MSKLRFGSPAWRAKYLGKKKLRSKAVRRRSNTRSVSMAKKGSRRGGSSMSGNVMNVALGAAILSFAAPKIALLQNPLVQAAGGYFLSRKGGMIGGIGTAGLVMGVTKLTSGITSGGVGSTVTEVFG